MATIKEKSLLIKVAGIMLLCGGIVSADYIEGTDTTDVNGYGLDSAFRVFNGYINGPDTARISYYCFFGGNGYFNYSFDDLKMAPNPHRQTMIPEPRGTVFNCFIIKKTKDSTYSKVQLLKQISGNRYLYKYGTNTTPNDHMLDSSTYDRSMRYKPNNLYNVIPYPPSWDSTTWEPPLPNNNHLLGYILYMTKRGAVIDTTAPINPAQWDSMTFTNSTMLSLILLSRVGTYFNLVAVYTEGKSDFLLGWTKLDNLADGVMQTQVPINLSKNRMEIKKAVGGYFISLPQLKQYAPPALLAVFNAAGVKVAQLSVVKGNGVLWKTDNLAEGTYLIRAELPDKSVLTRTVMFSR